MSQKEKRAYNQIDSQVLGTENREPVKYKKEKKMVHQLEATQPSQSQRVEYIAPKPKKALSAYICFITKSSKEVCEKEGIPYKDAFSKCAKLWSELTEDQKKPFNQEAEIEVKRHEREMKEYNETGFFVNKDGVNSSTLDKVKVKTKHMASSQVVAVNQEVPSEPEPVKPKKNMVPFMFLVKLRSREVMEQNKDTCKSAAGAIKILGEQWRNMDEAGKAKYVELSKKDLERHQKQMADFKENGWFTLEDGTKSSDMQPKTKLGKRKRRVSPSPPSQEQKKQKVQE